MNTPRTVLGSVTRITDFDRWHPEMEPRPLETWARGDYVVVEMLGDGPDSYSVETADGSAEELCPGDRLIGALGTRAATLELVGDWREVGEDLRMQTLTSAGVLGVCTSAAWHSAQMANVRYLGHAVRGGRVCSMKGFVTPTDPCELEAPVILIIGSSMDAGKTIAAVAMIRELVEMGKRVAGAKVTGVGRLRDTLAMQEAGAYVIADFVDVGLPSTVVPPEEYEQALRLLISKLAATGPDILVVEAGASPLEPYRGDVAMRVLAENVAITVLCASDPYAVMGVIDAFEMKPDLVSGRSTATEAGVRLIDRLVGIPALNMIERDSGPEVAEFLRENLPASFFS
ncbi:MAG: hypothetical protein JJE10_00715 [Thermoleophilia bacterium]|nr:hypothetical protein [Thermoleophilia bacterium]